MRIFEFLAVADPATTARLIRISAGHDVTVVLDLEDSLWDVTDQRRTAELKARGRRDLVELVSAEPARFARRRVAVRINRLSGGEAERDLEALARISRVVELEAVVLPKAETEADVVRCTEALRRHGVAHRALIPIVETRAGLANLDELMTAAVGCGVEWLIYGHYDLALDTGWWPIPEHDSTAFWEQVGPLIERIEAAGLGYVHPPFFQLYEVERFARIVGRVHAACSREYGVITLGRRQTAAADQLRREPWALAGFFAAAEDGSPTALARRVVAVFETNRRLGMSFALDARTGEFISPHVYLAARAHLESVDRRV